MAARAPATAWSARTRLQLLALAGAAFVFVTSEVQPIALLPQIADGFDVSEGAVGLILTAYAALAGLFAIPMTALAARRPRRELVLATVGVLVLSQAAAAAAPTYGLLVAARLICALAHGLFWSIIAQVAASLVQPGQGGRATAAVFTGNSLALVAGTPLVTAIGSATGWRVAFVVLGVAAALVVVVLARVLPELPARGPAARGEGRGAALGVLRDRSLLAVCAVTFTIVVGHFTAFTYFAPIVRDHTGLTGAALSAVFLAYGAAGVLGTILIGATTDRRPRRALLWCCAGLTLAMGLLTALTVDSTPLTILAVVLWGGAFTALPVALQSAVLRVVPAAADAASAVYVVAFQIGIGGGALLGALLVDGRGAGPLPVVAGAFIVVGSAVAAASRSAFPAAPAVAGPPAPCAQERERVAA